MKKWYNVYLSTKNGEKVFDTKDGKAAHTIIAQVQSKGNAYTVAEALKATYKPEYYSIVVD